MWADYFDSQNVRYAFFSAANAAALQELRREAEAAKEEAENRENELVGSESDDEESDDSDAEDENSSEEDAEENKHLYQVTEEDNPDGRDPRAKVLSVLELEDLFLKTAPDLSSTSPFVVIRRILMCYTAFLDSSGNRPSKLVVGLVGYPNVGKSSTINALIGEKKVSVSSTPGKTKHFQTINLSDTITLCDCPGLVFPQFATTKAALICDGILPIDQMREYTGPVAMIVKQITREVIEATYGLSIQTRGIEEGGDGIIRAADLLITYAGQCALLFHVCVESTRCSSRSWLHPCRPRYSRRSSRRTIYPQRLHERKASILSSPTRPGIEHVQRGDPSTSVGKSRGHEKGTTNSSWEKRIHFHPIERSGASRRNGFDYSPRHRPKNKDSRPELFRERHRSVASAIRPRRWKQRS